MKRSLTFVFIWALLLVSFPSNKSWAYSSLYVFGDSLSDQGNFFLLSGGTVPPPEYNGGGVNGRFTNGKNYIDYLAPMLGLTSTSSLLGSTNYAFGGARTYYHPQLGYQGSLLGQYDSYGSSSHSIADPDALYIVWAGANNLKDILLPPSGIAFDPLLIPGELKHVATDVGFVISSLAASGARNILVPNLPDLGVVPLATGGGPPNTSASLLTANYNSILASILSGFSGINLMQFDTFSFLDDVYYNNLLPNVTDVAYDKFVEPGGTTVTNPENYLSWDGFHPTTVAHQMLAEQIYSKVVPEPSSFLLFGSGIAAGFLFYRRNRARL